MVQYFVMGWRLIARALLIFSVSLFFALVVGVHWAAVRIAGRAREARAALLGRHLTRYCRALGATFIKVGQILATRPDLASRALREQLATLHDRVGPFPFHYVREVLQADFGAAAEELFEHVDPYPVASASVAQVHRGTLRDGRSVAIKVLRPGIENVVRCDLRLLHIGAALLSWIPPLRMLGVREAATSFADAIWRQLDLALEADNNRAFAENFRSVPDVAFPQLVPELSGRRVLCMEFIDGQPILSRSWERSTELVRTGFRMVLKMIFVDGFVHADLHPGNIFVVDGKKLVVVDLGLVGHVAERHRQGLTRLLLAWGARDVDQICEGIAAVAFYGQAPADPARLRGDVGRLLEEYRDRPLAAIEVGALLQHILRTVRGQWLKLDPATTIIALAIGVVEGVGKQLAPGLRIVDEALPFIQGAPPAAA